MTNMIKPVFIIGTPRSGTTMLFNILSQSEQLWSLYTESTIWNEVLGPDKKNWVSMELSRNDATPDVVRRVKQEFLKQLRNNEINSNTEKGTIRMIEKTPDNCFRIDFIHQIFPDAKFIYIKRDGRNVISSMMEAWRHYRKFNVPARVNINLQNGSYTDKWWGSLPKGWRNYTHSNLVDVCTFQWIEATKKALESFSQLSPSKVVVVRFEDLITQRHQEVSRICQSIGIPYTKNITEAANRIYPVNLSKWKENNCQEILGVYNQIRDVMIKTGYPM